jgi:predicted DNA-binding transcriptional regulator YafY
MQRARQRLFARQRRRKATQQIRRDAAIDRRAHHRDAQHRADLPQIACRRRANAHLARGQRDQPDAALLINLSQAIGQQQCVALDYRSPGDELTHRTVEPYGVVGWQGHWYLVGYCRLRRDHRTFRIDRIQRARTLEERFERPADFDCQEFILRRYGAPAGGVPIEVEFQAPLSAVERRIPTAYGQLTATPDVTLLQTRYDNLDDMARYLLGANLPFVVRQPPELRDALRRLGERILGFASATPSAGDAASA